MHLVRATGGARPLRVLLLSDCWSPTVNGVVRSVTDLRDGLAAAGHDVRVLTVADHLSTTFDGRVYGVASIPAGAVYPHARIGRPVSAPVMRHITEWAPDVVHSHTEFPTFAWARCIARRVGVAHVHTYHTSYEDYTHYFCPSRRVGRAMTRAFTRDLLGRTDRVIAPTRKVAELLHGYGVANPIEVIGTGVDLDQFRPAATDPRSTTADTTALADLADLAASIGLAPHIPVVLTVGRLAAEKNLTETLRLLAGITDAPWQWLVVGDGPVAGELRDLAAHLGVAERVHMTGAVPAGEVARLYRLADAFVTSSRSETQGLTCLEALASGLPTITPDDDAFRGLIADGINGHRYASQDDFTAIATRLLSDGPLRRTMSASARASAVRCGRGQFVDEVLGCYRRAMEGKRQRYGVPHEPRMKSA
ncbi:glycosyltransferase [Corynebacterium sp. NPDC060344]|uniref:glycosyltransferase n=1 Tax=Corynebacterium sp. NPDC060344 TaxID=3347101 RepID=UPI00364FB748